MTVFRSLGTYNYRLWFTASLLGNVGSWVQTITVNWFVLTALTDGDAVAVGVTLAVQFAPALLLMPLTGWVADRFDRRSTIIAIQSLLAAQALTVALLVGFGVVTFPLMLVLSAVFGVLTAFDAPLRQAFVSELVDPGDLPNAVALNAASLSLGRLIGPAVAGVILATAGAEWAFAANGACFLLLLLAAAVLRRAEITRPERRGRRFRILGGFAYVGSRSDIALVVATMGLVGVLGMNVHFTSSIVVEMFGGDATDFGIANSLMAAGSLVGALVAARRTEATVGAVVASFGIMAVAAAVGAWAPVLVVYSLSLVVTGFGMMIALASAGAYIQSSTPADLRGRVLAVYSAVIMGSLTVGSPLLGWIATAAGARWAVAVGAIASAAACAAGLLWLRRRHRTDEGS